MTANPHALVGPYVLDALSRAEREGFEAHLGECAQCQSELTELRAAVDRLDQAKLLPRSVD